jgi:magnesium-transporting ATPase (P-type)
MLMKKDKLDEYLQIFQDAGWEYVGEMSNWRYWRKQVVNGETPEIFTDNESKIKKYQRMLGIMVFFLVFLIFISMNMLINQPWGDFNNAPLINTIYLFGALCYAVIIPIYVVVVVKLLRRINQLKQKSL